MSATTNTAASAITTWDVASIDVPWLNKTLSKHFSKEVVKFDVIPVTDVVSLGRLYRLTVEFNDGSTASCFLKQESGNAGANKFATRAKCFSSEATFYSELSSLCKARIPKCYYSTVSPAGNATTLLLDDVIYTTAGTKHTDLTLPQLKAAVIELGKFHASYLENEKMLGAGMPPATQHFSLFQVSALLPMFLSFWEDLLKEYEEEEEEDSEKEKANEKTETESKKEAVVGAEASTKKDGKEQEEVKNKNKNKNKVVDVLSHCALNHANYLGLLEMAGPPSLIHGEYSPSNLLFGEGITDEEQSGNGSSDPSAAVTATVVDFQTLYIGGDVARADDLNCLLVSSVSSNVRAANEKAMIGFYLEALKEAVPEERKEQIPSPEEFMHYYKMATQGMIYRCLLLNMMLSGLPEESRRHHLDSLMGRVFDAVTDHGLFTVLAIGRK